MNNTITARLLGPVTFFLLLTGQAAAELAGIEIERQETLSSGETSLQYRAIHGRLHFTLDPDAPANAAITDIAHAPVNAEGLVEFSSDFKLLTPLGRPASGTLLYHVNNRGRSTLPPERSLTHPLTAQGHTYLVTGWINELVPDGNRLRLDAPVVEAEDGPITGDVRYEVIVNSTDNDVNIAGSGHLAYAPTARGLISARLSSRMNQDDPREDIERRAFSLQVSNVEGAHQPMVTLQVDGGFEPGRIYELIYEARDPVLSGAGMAGIRDAVSLLRHGGADGQLAARLADLDLPEFEHSVAWGHSQSGRLLRQFVHEGFNADLEGRQVFDGVVPVIAGGGMGLFNNRFAMPTRTNGQHENHLFPSDRFPFTYGESSDPFTGRSDGILRRSRETGTVPRVMHIQTSNEYWVRGGSLPHTDPTGSRDAEIPEEVRFYTIGGSEHGSGDGRPGEPTRGRLPDNPNMWAPFAESLLSAMIDWVSEDRQPPPSRYPRIADDTLVDSHLQENIINPRAWRPLPGVIYPQTLYRVAHADHGARFPEQGIIDRHPRSAEDYYGVKVPAVGQDNNDLADSTVLPPLADVPLASFVPWNLRAPETGAVNELARLAGGYVPLPRTEAETEQTRDPRPSIEFLYNGFDDYLNQYEAATDELIEEGYLLPAYKERLMAIARDNRSVFGQDP